MEWQTKFGERLALLESKINKLTRVLDDTNKKSSSILQLIDASIHDIGKLEAEADVMTDVLYL